MSVSMEPPWTSFLSFYKDMWEAKKDSFLLAQKREGIHIDTTLIRSHRAWEGGAGVNVGSKVACRCSSSSQAKSNLQPFIFEICQLDVRRRK